MYCSIVTIEFTYQEITRMAPVNDSYVIVFPIKVFLMGNDKTFQFLVMRNI